MQLLRCKIACLLPVCGGEIATIGSQMRLSKACPGAVASQSRTEEANNKIDLENTLEHVDQNDLEAR